MKVQKKKTYFVRIRAYKTSGKNKIYGKWSITKKVKIRKRRMGEPVGIQASGNNY